MVAELNNKLYNKFMAIIKKAKKVAEGLIDYARQSANANQQADKNLRENNSYSTVSSQDNMNMLSDETERIKRERNISLRNSIRNKLGK